MSRPTFTILKKDTRGKRAIYEILADDAAGFDSFIRECGAEVLPGSTVDIAAYKRVFRLLNNGNWEEYRSYASSEELYNQIETEAVEAILNDLVPDEEEL